MTYFVRLSSGMQVQRSTECGSLEDAQALLAKDSEWIQAGGFEPQDATENFARFQVFKNTVTLDIVAF